jgi:hypothetical protein
MNICKIILDKNGWKLYYEDKLFGTYDSFYQAQSMKLQIEGWYYGT